MTGAEKRAYKKKTGYTGDEPRRRRPVGEEAEAVDEGGMGGMQSGSRKSKIEKSGTHSSMLAYLTKSKRAGWSDRGRSSAKEKKRASKEARQAGKKETEVDESHPYRLKNRMQQASKEVLTGKKAAVAKLKSKQAAANRSSKFWSGNKQKATTNEGRVKVDVSRGLRVRDQEQEALKREREALERERRSKPSKPRIQTLKTGPRTTRPTRKGYVRPATSKEHDDDITDEYNDITDTRTEAAATFAASDPSDAGWRKHAPPSRSSGVISAVKKALAKRKAAKEYKNLNPTSKRKRLHYKPGDSIKQKVRVEKNKAARRKENMKKLGTPTRAHYKKRLKDVQRSQKAYAKSGGNLLKHIGLVKDGFGEGKKSGPPFKDKDWRDEDKYYKNLPPGTPGRDLRPRTPKEQKKLAKDVSRAMRNRPKVTVKMARNNTEDMDEAIFDMPIADKAIDAVGNVIKKTAKGTAKMASRAITKAIRKRVTKKGKLEREQEKQEKIKLRQEREKTAEAKRKARAKRETQRQHGDRIRRKKLEQQRRGSKATTTNP